MFLKDIFTRDGDRLFAQGFAKLPHNRPGDLTGLPKFELFAEGEKNFFARVSDSQITFESGPEGRTARLILRKGGRDMSAPRLS
jgi:D-alanyl-D-alanine-carboxypeptidase/D-alanyl-D-alanine-endopeptidase